MDFYVTTDKEFTGFNPKLANWLWHIAIAIAPLDTGNLRRSITLNSNSPTRLTYVYNAFNAIYLHYLEEGMGNVKKYKDFIKVDTVGAFIQELIYFIKTGQTGLLTSTPYITLRESKNGAMFYEKKLLKALDISKNTLTADDRRRLSNIRYRGLVGSNITRAGGQAPTTKRLYSKSKNLQTNYFFMDTKGY